MSDICVHQKTLCILWGCCLFLFDTFIWHISSSVEHLQCAVTTYLIEGNPHTTQEVGISVPLHTRDTKLREMEQLFRKTQPGKG